MQHKKDNALLNINDLPISAQSYITKKGEVL